MIVGTYCTGDGRYGPSPFSSGTQAGSCTNFPFAGSHQPASRKLSHPQPGPCFDDHFDRCGLLPRNPSSVAAAMTRCPPHEGVFDNSNVRSLIANALASAARFGI